MTGWCVVCLLLLLLPDFVVCFCRTLCILVMDSKLVLLFALVALFCAVQAKSAPDVLDILTGKDKKDNVVPVQPIEDEVDVEDKDESSEEVAVSEELVEEGSAEVEEAANICADISGVWCSARSDAKLIIIQDDDRVVSGLFRNNTDSAWYEVSGFRGNYDHSAFGFSSIREELKGVASVAGLCNPCDGSLDLSLIIAFPLHECKSHAIPMPGYNYQSCGSAEKARNVVGAFYSVDETEEASGEE